MIINTDKYTKITGNVVKCKVELHENECFFSRALIQYNSFDQLNNVVYCLYCYKLIRVETVKYLKAQLEGLHVNAVQIIKSVKDTIIQEMFT